MDDYIFTIDGIQIGGKSPVRIMGVINLSPESFYSDSIVRDEAELLTKVKGMIEEGADFLDIGAASTAPKNHYGTEDISRRTEISRVNSSLSIIVDNVDVPISIDTTSAEVAELALDLGAVVINDVTGLQGDSAMAKLVADRDSPVILMAHCPKGCESVNDSLIALQKSLKIADDAGVPRENIILDPGIGFGKPSEVDCAILRELKEFKQFKRPLLVGVSRKAFIGDILNEENPKNRLIGSLAATAIAVVHGADVIRTHDVGETRSATRMGEALR